MGEIEQYKPEPGFTFDSGAFFFSRFRAADVFRG